ncbi:MAG: leucine-rich repeat domain-containing protein [Promethearchaeota archaeon]
MTYEELGTYQGVPLLRREGIALTVLEALFGTLIPHVAQIKEDKPSFTTKNYSIDGLSLVNCRITSLPGILFQLRNIRTLNLNYNRLLAIPWAVGRLVNLENLDIRNNHLYSLPDSIGSLTRLKSLLCENNHLGTVPESIENLTDLEVLCLDHNQLIRLPEKIGNLINLRFLSLDHNQLMFLPESIGSLRNLYRLHLEFNQLMSLPETFKSLINLECLSLSKNSFQIDSGTVNSLLRVLFSKNFYLYPDVLKVLKGIEDSDKEIIQFLILHGNDLPRRSLWQLLEFLIEVETPSAELIPLRPFLHSLLASSSTPTTNLYAKQVLSRINLSSRPGYLKKIRRLVNRR